MATKLFSSRIVPLDERILIRIPESVIKKGSVLVAETNPENGKFDVKSTQAVRLKNYGIVVAVGPGQRSSATGERIPIDENIVPGAEVHFAVGPGSTPSRPPAMRDEMEAEGLWFIIESQIECVLRPAGVDARRPVLA